MARSIRRLPTRFGALTVVVDDAVMGDRPAPAPGAVVASGFRETALLDARGEADSWQPDAAPIAAALLDFIAAAVADWSTGRDLAALDRVPVGLPVGGFRERAWRSLRAVPPGEVVSYRELAELAGNAGAARAAGTACASNPVAPFVPCHRVVRSGGGLGEYGYGPQTKAAMLEHEGAWP